MLLDEQANKYRALDRWFASDQGLHVAAAFSEVLKQLNEPLSGNKLLQLGCCGENPWLSVLNFRNEWLVTPGMIPEKSTVVASFSALPFARDSVDCIVAPLTLEAFPRGKMPIDEMDRILKPMGHIIFFGINPLSFWGIGIRLGYINCFGSPAKPTFSLLLKNRMLHRGYEQCAWRSFYYIPPVSSSIWIKRLTFLNEMGKMLWPLPAGFYCYILQKQPYHATILQMDLTQHVALKVPG